MAVTTAARSRVFISYMILTIKKLCFYDNWNNSGVWCPLTALLLCRGGELSRDLLTPFTYKSAPTLQIGLRLCSCHLIMYFHYNERIFHINKYCPEIFQEIMRFHTILGVYDIWAWWHSIDQYIIEVGASPLMDISCLFEIDWQGHRYKCIGRVKPDNDANV